MSSATNRHRVRCAAEKREPINSDGRGEPSELHLIEECPHARSDIPRSETDDILQRRMKTGFDPTTRKRQPRGLLARLLMGRGTITSAPTPRRVIACQFPRQALSSRVIVLLIIDSPCVECLPTVVGRPPGVTSSPSRCPTQEALLRSQDYARGRHHGDGLCSGDPVALSQVRPLRGVSSLSGFQGQLSPHGSSRPAMLAAALISA